MLFRNRVLTFFTRQILFSLIENNNFVKIWNLLVITFIVKFIFVLTMITTMMTFKVLTIYIAMALLGTWMTKFFALSRQIVFSLYTLRTAFLLLLFINFHLISFIINQLDKIVLIHSMWLTLTIYSETI